MRSARSTTELHPPAENPFSGKGIHSVTLAPVKFVRSHSLASVSAQAARFHPPRRRLRLRPPRFGPRGSPRSATPGGPAAAHPARAASSQQGDWAPRRAGGGGTVVRGAALAERLRGLTAQAPGREGAAAWPPAPPVLEVVTWGPASGPRRRRLPGARLHPGVERWGPSVRARKPRALTSPHPPKKTTFSGQLSINWVSRGYYAKLLEV